MRRQKGTDVPMKGLHIISTGRCLPHRVVTNDDMSKIVETSDEWISTRTGIKQRYLCEEETQLDLAIGAARQAMERSGIAKEELGACVAATFTGNYATPSTACLIQKELDLPTDMPSLDVNAACSGFLYALQVTRGLLLQSERRYALVLGVEQLSRITDFTDRGTCVLFGDGGAAAVVELSDSHRFYSVLGARGDTEALRCPGINQEGRSNILMRGNDVFRFAVDCIPRCINEVLEQGGLTLDQVDHVICHQANERIIRHVIKKLGAREGQFYLNLSRYGNTSAASIPIALDEMVTDGLLRPGMNVILVGFGAGFTWGGIYLEL